MSGYTISKGIPYPNARSLEAEWTNIPRPEPNYTPPGKPTFVDIFKGKDDTNYLQKTGVLLKHTGYYSALALLADVCVGTQPKDLTGYLRRIGFWGIPAIGGGIAYTTAVCVAGSLRKKTDQWNHAIGGIAAGSVIGAARSNYLTGFVVSVGLMLTGALYKESVMDGWEIWPNPRNHQRGFAMSHKLDMTMQKHIPGNWYTDPTPQPYPPSPPACK